MALPPCHIFAQFYVSGESLSCQMYQRSCDVGLGLPFNIVSYSILTKILAHVCNLKPKQLIYVLGDAHIYMNHYDELKNQMNRTPYDFPTLTITKQLENNKSINYVIEFIESMQYEDFILHGYKHHEAIVLPIN